MRFGTLRDNQLREIETILYSLASSYFVTSVVHFAHVSLSLPDSVLELQYHRMRDRTILSYVLLHAHHIHARTHIHTHAHAHARTHTRTHAHARMRART